MEVAMNGGATLAACALLAALAGCGKVQEQASEKMAEKAIEASMTKEGGQAKVELSGGTVSITSSDAAGKTTQMEMGGAKVTEAELGLPFYPGTRPLEGQSTRLVSPDGTMYSIGLHSNDASDKVAGYYREKLKAQAEGKQFMDISAGDGNAVLSLADEKSQGSFQVHVSKADKGTDIQLVANRRGVK
jgi:hypothetical protein